MKKLTTKLTSYQQDIAVRAGDFFLMPEAPFPPAIASDLPANVTQKTFVKEIVDGVVQYEDLVIRDRTYYVTAGTELEMIIVAQDPSQVDMDRIGDETNLTFQWFRDGAPIVAANALRNGRGFRGLRLPAAEVTIEATGEYHCEVSNAYGTTETTSVFISVVDPRRHPLMYKNLIQNGSAGGGTEGWQVDNGIISRAMLDDNFLTYHFGSLPPLRYYDDDLEKPAPADPPHDFRFSQAGNSSTLWPAFKTLLSKNPDAFKKDAKTDINSVLPDWMAWMVRSMPPRIVTNEDISLGSGERAGFFPGLKWMDLFNRNNNPSLIGLDGEFVDKALNYFTRDKLKFERAGGQATATLTQNINVENASALIDNTVLGVPPIQGQFFSYVGAGITGYNIRVSAMTTEEGEGEQVFNWFVLDPDEFFKRLKSGTDNRILIQEGSVIEIIPLMEDKTDITLTMRDAGLTILSQVRFDGPDATDVFAIKEKSYFPLCWYPIFDFFITNNNPIKIFGQTYTTTKALQPLMSPNPAIPEKEIVDYIYELEISDLYSGPGKVGPGIRKDVKDLIIDYMGASGNVRLTTRKEVDDLVLRASTRRWNINALIAERKAKGDFYTYEIPGVVMGSKEYEIKRRRQINKILKDIIQAQDPDQDTTKGIPSRIQVKIIETPIYAVVNPNNESVNGINNSDTSRMDKNAAFFINNIPFKEGGQYIPRPANEWEPYKRTPINSKRTHKALEEHGAAAMFAVGGNFPIPENTRTIEVKITFTHTSPAFTDQQPEMRGWTSDFIYRNDFGNKAADSVRFTEYGYPRCGITMMKLLLLPQNAAPEENYTSYFIPSAGNQVWGLQKRALYDERFTNTSEPGDFVYNFIMPDTPGTYKPTDIYELSKLYDTFTKGVGTEELRLNPGFDPEELQQFQDTVVLREDSSPGRAENDSVVINEESGLTGNEQPITINPNLNTQP